MIHVLVLSGEGRYSNPSTRLITWPEGSISAFFRLALTFVVSCMSNAIVIGLSQEGNAPRYYSWDVLFEQKGGVHSLLRD